MRPCQAVTALIVTVLSHIPLLVAADGDVLWSWEKVTPGNALDFGWMGNSKGGSIASEAKGGLRGVAYARDCSYEGTGSLRFHVTKATKNDWAFAAITCGDPATGSEATSWQQVDAGVDISRCSIFEVYVRGEGNARIELKDIDENSSRKVTLGDHGAFTKDTWTRIEVPLTAFGLQDGLLDTRHLKAVLVMAEETVPEGAGSWTYHLDNMAFRVKGDPIAAPFTPPVHAGTVAAPFTANHWTTVFADGSRKDTALGAAWGDAAAYDADQDQAFTLLKKGAPLTSAAGEGGQDIHIFVDAGSPGRPAMGLGGSMTDSSAYLLGQLKTKNPALYDLTMQRLFSAEDGAGFSVVRIPLGASDYTAAKGYYTYCDEESPDLAAFSIAREQAYLIPVLKDALRINPGIRFFGSPWSAPAWMKTNGDLHGITAAQKNAGRTNRLKPDCFPLYATYLAKTLEAFAKEGVPFWGLTLQNEPQFDSADYPCMRMTQADQLALTAELAKALDARKLDARILVHDHNWILHPDDRAVLGGDAKEDPLTMVKAIYADPVVGPRVAGSAWHCYAGSAGDMATVYRDLAANFPDKLTLTTEVTAWGKRGAAWADNVTWGLTNNWFATFANGGAASLQWNLVLDHNYGPTPRTDSLAYGLATVFTDTYREVKFEREFYAMAQMSKAVGGGGRQLRTVVFQGTSPSFSCAALAFHRDDRTIGVVILNRSKRTPAPVAIDYRGQTFRVTVPPQALETLVWQDDAAAAAR